MVLRLVRHFYKSVLIFGLVALLFGCSKSVDREDTLVLETGASVIASTQEESSGFPVVSSTPREPSTVETPVLALTSTRKSTSTLAITQTSTSTPIPTSSPTSTLLLTLHPDEALQVVNGFFENNGGCELPCWWGIHPGETSLKEARKILFPFSSELGYWKVGNNNAVKYEYSIPIPEGSLDPHDLGYFGVNLWAKDDIVIAIGLNTARITSDFDYSLDRLLEEFGQPEEIWVYTMSEAMGNPPRPPYDLNLFYSESGIMLSSSGQADELKEDTVVICPSEFRLENYPPAIVLFSPGAKVTYNELTGSIYNRSVSHLGSFQLLRELTYGFDEAEFYRVYSDPNADTCINILIDLLE